MGLFSWVSNGIKSCVNTVSSAISSVGTAITKTAKVVQNVANVVSNAAQVVYNVGKQVVEKVNTVLDKVSNSIEIINKKISYYQDQFFQNTFIGRAITRANDWFMNETIIGKGITRVLNKVDQLQTNFYEKTYIGQRLAAAKKWLDQTPFGRFINTIGPIVKVSSYFLGGVGGILTKGIQYGAKIYDGYSQSPSVIMNYIQTNPFVNNLLNKKNEIFTKLKNTINSNIIQPANRIYEETKNYINESLNWNTKNRQNMMNYISKSIEETQQFCEKSKQTIKQVSESLENNLQLLKEKNLEYLNKKKQINELKIERLLNMGKEAKEKSEQIYLETTKNIKKITDKQTEWINNQFTEYKEQFIESVKLQLNEFAQQKTKIIYERFQELSKDTFSEGQQFIQKAFFNLEQNLPFEQKDKLSSIKNNKQIFIEKLSQYLNEQSKIISDSTQTQFLNQAQNQIQSILLKVNNEGNYTNEQFQKNCKKEFSWISSNINQYFTSIDEQIQKEIKQLIKSNKNKDQNNNKYFQNSYDKIIQNKQKIQKKTEGLIENTQSSFIEKNQQTKQNVQQLFQEQNEKLSEISQKYTDKFKEIIQSYLNSSIQYSQYLNKKQEMIKLTEKLSDETKDRIDYTSNDYTQKIQFKNNINIEANKTQQIIKDELINYNIKSKNISIEIQVETEILEQKLIKNVKILSKEEKQLTETTESLFSYNQQLIQNDIKDNNKNIKQIIIDYYKDYKRNVDGLREKEQINLSQSLEQQLSSKIYTFKKQYYKDFISQVDQYLIQNTLEFQNYKKQREKEQINQREKVLKDLFSHENTIPNLSSKPMVDSYINKFNQRYENGVEEFLKKFEIIKTNLYPNNNNSKSDVQILNNYIANSQISLNSINFNFYSDPNQNCTINGKLELQNRTNKTLNFEIPDGQIFGCKTRDTYQHTVVRGIKGQLNPLSTQIYQLQAFCADLSLKWPENSNDYDLTSFKLKHFNKFTDQNEAWKMTY